MLEYILIGSGFAFAAAVQPGPFQAFLLNHAAQNGWKRTLPAAFSPLISDGPVALLAIFVLHQIPPVMNRVLRGAGGIFLLYIAYRSFLQWKRQPEAEPETGGRRPRTILQAAGVNLLNPGPWLGWTLVMGPIFLDAWARDPAFGIALVAAFYITMIVSLIGIILLFGAARLLGPAGQRALILVSAVVIAALGVYQIVVSVW